MARNWLGSWLGSWLGKWTGATGGAPTVALSMRMSFGWIGPEVRRGTCLEGSIGAVTEDIGPRITAS